MRTIGRASGLFHADGPKGRAADIRSSTIAERVASALERHGLVPLAARDPRTLSAGEKTRTLLAAMLAARPSVLLLDQCLAHLDPAARRDEEERIAVLARGGRLGVLRASQELEPAASGERIAVLAGGRIRDASDLTPAAVLADPATPFPLSLRASAALSAEGRWSGPLLIQPRRLPRPTN